MLYILFIGVLYFDAAGAALATKLAQTLSVFISLVMIRRRRLIDIHRSELRPHRSKMGAILKVGIPVALQDGFIQMAFIVITIIANMRGLNDVAGGGIVEKVIGALFLVPSAILSAVSAIGAQNVGAGKMYRTKSTLWQAKRINSGLRHRHCHHRTIHGQLGRQHFHRRSECHHFRRTISSFLYLGHWIGEHSLLLQRILLRMRSLHHFVHPHLFLHRTRPHSVQLSLLNQLSRLALPDGHCHAHWFTRLIHLRGLLLVFFRKE